MLSGWGRARRSASVTLSPDAPAEVMGVFAGPRRAHGLIARGAGRSYGDCALNAEGEALLTAGLDGIIGFDPSTRILQAEPGVTFAQVLRMFLPQGVWSPVTPGTSLATLGGAVAHDVHGKNHERSGSFCDHVTELDLLTPDGTLRTVSPGRDPALFDATCGGLGLTGVVTRVALRLAPASPTLQVTERRVADLSAFLAALDGAAGAAYAVGWIDGTARGAALGRGVLETAEPAADTLPAPRAGRGVAIPFDFPAFVLNPRSIALFNAAYYRRVPAAGRTRLARCERFFYPLDAIGGWNRIYGARGFHQFQNVVPFERGEAALRALLEVIAGSRRASFLAVLKRLGPAYDRPGSLSFPRPGYTLALDFPAGPGIEALYARLVAITLSYGGRVYLAKDGLLDAASFRAMYPELPAFLRILKRVDPEARLQSDMSRRLDLRAAA